MLAEQTRTATAPLRALQSERAYLVGLRDEAAARENFGLVVIYRREIDQIDAALMRLRNDA